MIKIFKNISGWVFCKVDLKNIANSTRKYLFMGHFLIKKAYNFIKKRLQHRCFLLNFVKLLRTLFYRTAADDCFCNLRRRLPFCLMGKSFLSAVSSGFAQRSFWFIVNILRDLSTLL